MSRMPERRHPGPLLERIERLPPESPAVPGYVEPSEREPTEPWAGFDEEPPLAPF
jgi:hypothetical protein